MTFHEMQTFLYEETCHMLGIDPTAYPKNFMPLNSTAAAAVLKLNTGEYIFYLAQPVDDAINRQIDTIKDDTSDSDTLVNRTIRQIRNWRFRWEFYGPDGYDKADKIRLALLSDSTRRAEFSAKGLSLITDIPAPVLAPDPINLQWFYRFDLYADFNECVDTVTTSNAIASTEIIIEDNKGVRAECSI
jgi:hypothetical protein